jgi:glycosyltransferase involved in cell wall biosynthesis
MRIGIYSQGGAHWPGGQQYTTNLVSALRKYGEDCEVFALSSTGDRIVVESPSCTPDTEASACSVTTAGWLYRQLNRATRLVWGKDVWLSQALGKLPAPIDVVFPGGWGLGPRTAVMGLIYDLQYLHLPEMFSRSEARGRLSWDLRTIRSFDVVIVSSQAAKADFMRIAPAQEYKCRVMPFVADAPGDIYDVAPMTILAPYQLPERFFYLPNQLWKHKNHMVVLEALRILAQRNCRPLVVMTGTTEDSRNPGYAQEFKGAILGSGLRDQVRLLGLVPRQDVYQLIRQSLRVINPSRFEGWSTTVEEARSVGKGVLLSDIPVHREQDPPLAEYFSPPDAEMLAAKLERIWQEAPGGPDAELEAAARAVLPARMAEYARSFCAYAREAVAFRQGPSQRAANEDAR